MELREIESIVEMMTRNDLAEFDLEREGFRIRIRRGAERPAVVTAAPAPNPAQAAAAPAETPADPAAGTFEIPAPMVGTFYRASSPDSPPYVQVGQEVTEETVVCIIEAMKVMNEIKAETRGVITDILTENGTPVDFGKPLFRLKAP